MSWCVSPFEGLKLGALAVFFGRETLPAAGERDDLMVHRQFKERRACCGLVVIFAQGRADAVPCGQCTTKVVRREHQRALNQGIVRQASGSVGRLRHDDGAGVRGGHGEGDGRRA